MIANASLAFWGISSNVRGYIGFTQAT